MSTKQEMLKIFAEEVDYEAYTPLQFIDKNGEIKRRALNHKLLII